MTPALEISDLRTEIRLRDGTVKAVDGVSLTIEPGETVGLVGESGSGKTMTGLSILQLLPRGGRIVGGSVKVGGRELVDLSDREMERVRGDDVAMIFQDPMTSLNPTMRIGRQIAEVMLLHRSVGREEATERAVEVLAQVGMPQPRERLDYFPHQLSGGLRQRAMIAMALVCEPKVLIADEPTTALDATIQAQILALLDSLKADGMGILLVTHDMGVIAGHADRVHVMYAGQTAEVADTQRLFTAMYHPYTEALLESIPDPEQDRSLPLYSIPGLPPNLMSPPQGCRFAPRCRYATDRCRTEEPPLVDAGHDHGYACFHPVNVAGEHRVPRPSATAGGQEVNVSVARSAGLPDSSVLLEMDAVVKEYPVDRGVLMRNVGSVKAVSGVSFTVRRGETFGLVGESGCGKSTIARLIVGLERLTSGTIRLDGEDLGQTQHRRLRPTSPRVQPRKLQLMFQDPYTSLDPRLRVRSILKEPLDIQKIGDKRATDSAARAILEEVWLSSSAAERYPHEFSGGQRQRIGLARALILEPDLLIADEPVSALDVSVRSQILNLMLDVQRRRGLSYVIISHDLSVMRYMADRIGVMYLGKLMEVGSSADVYRSPVHPYTAGLIAAIPSPDPLVERTKSREVIKGELPSAVNPPSGCRFRTRCPFATEICVEVEPELAPFGHDHAAACHHPLRS